MIDQTLQGYVVENMKFQKLSQCIGKDLRGEFMPKYASWPHKTQSKFPLNNGICEISNFKQTNQNSNSFQ